MNEKREEEPTKKIEITQAEPVAQGDEEHAEKKDKAAEKSPGKMTKKEFLQEIKDLHEESKKNYDLYLRSQAEMENIKKRNKKEKEEWIRYSNENLIKQMLPVIDNLEKAISHSHNENPLDALREGVELTLKGLKDNLVKSGLEEVKAKGERFDPCFHQAVSEQEDEGVEAGIILHELQKGYTLYDRLLRPAMVVVSKANPGSTTTDHKTPENACEE
ncbi:MAG: nucleotide exchange factor GrpE [Deltaproteobacteria bacterium]|nr:nucleotide exchange factor GrpE [Deltaproteobacteria bacterium]MBL7175064.1 nucleotide exchange factor GrpE [Desulfobacteraceae bacterium]